MVLLTILTATLFLLPNFALAQLPNGACSIEEASCEIQEDNLLGILSGISSAEECRQACENNATTCEYFSYYGPTSFPFIETCLLFSSCPVLDPCTDCFTEELDCFDAFCEAPVEGSLSDNLIQVLGNIEDELYCKYECQSEDRCKFYTFHRENATLQPSTCYLLSALREPLLECQADTCISGTPNCESSLCAIVDDGFIFPSGKLVAQSKTIGLLRMGNCPTPTVVAVGGGGYSSGGAGGGSGFIEYSDIKLNRPYALFVAQVGSAGQASYVTDVYDNTTAIVRAEKGSDNGPGSWDGGSGYSGGGGGAEADPSNLNGGSDGGDGFADCGAFISCGTGGKGSGLDVSTIPLQSFSLRYVMSLI